MMFVFFWSATVKLLIFSQKHIFQVILYYLPEYFINQFSFFVILATMIRMFLVLRFFIIITSAFGHFC